MDKYGFSYFLKGYSYYVARKVCESVPEWLMIPDKGSFGIGSMSDLANLGRFCNPVPQLRVFGFRQLKEVCSSVSSSLRWNRNDNGKYENSHYITNVPDYMRLSLDGTLTGDTITREHLSNLP